MWAKALIPPVIVLLTLGIFTRLYAVLRRSRYRRRRDQEVRAILDLRIPDTTLKPDGYPEVQPLHALQHSLIATAPAAQESYFSRALVSSLIPTLAVICLLLQILYWPD